jgi:hypothetical protein
MFLKNFVHLASSAFFIFGRIFYFLYFLILHWINLLLRFFFSCLFSLHQIYFVLLFIESWGGSSDYLLRFSSCWMQTIMLEFSVPSLMCCIFILIQFNIIFKDLFWDFLFHPWFIKSVLWLAISGHLSTIDL